MDSPSQGGTSPQGQAEKPVAEKPEPEGDGKIPDPAPVEKPTEPGAAVPSPQSPKSGDSGDARPAGGGVPPESISASKEAPEDNTGDTTDDAWEASAGEEESLGEAAIGERSPADEVREEEGAPREPPDGDEEGERVENMVGRGVETLYRMGLRARKRRQFRRAESYFQAVLQTAPYHFLTRLTLGKMYLNSDPSAALDHLRIALQVVPSSDKANYAKGRALEALGRPLEAAETFRRTIYLNPRHYNANKRLRNILRGLRADKSVVQRAAEVFYGNPSLATLTLFGRIVMEQALPRQAVLEFEEVRERQPELPEAELWLARARKAVQDEDGEIRAYGNYLERNPEAMGVRLLLVERLAGQGWFQKAATYLEPFNGDGGRGRPGLSAEERSRITFLRSRLLSAQQQPARAGELLLLAHAQSYGAAEIERAFGEDLALYPETPALWFTYGTWLQRTGQHGESAGAFRQAALLDPGHRAKAEAALDRILKTRKAPEAARLALAELSYAGGKPSEALAHLDHIAPGHPLDHRAALLRGKIHLRNGDLDAALDAFTRYVFFFRERRDILYARGNLFWELGRKKEALAIWMENPDVLIQHPQVLLKVAARYRDENDIQQEIVIRERLLEALPANQDNRIRLGELYVHEERLLEAVLLWERLIGERPRDPDLLTRTARGWLALKERKRGLKLLQRAAQLKPLALEDAELLARELYATNQYEEALAVYWSLYQTRPDHPDLPEALPVLALNVPAREEILRTAARLALGKGRLKQAAEVLEILVHQHPSDQEARVSLAETYLRLDRPEAAGQVLFGPDAVPRGSETGLTLLGRVQEKTGRREALVETLSLLQSLRPRDTALMRRRGLLLASLGRHETARPLLVRSLEENGRDAEVLLVLAGGDAAFGNLVRAEARLASLLEMEPNHGMAQRKRIDLLIRLGRWEEVITALETWLESHPRDRTARYNMITAYLKGFRKEEARPHFEVLRKLDPIRARSLERYFR